VVKTYGYDEYGTPTATGTRANELDFGGQQTDPTGLQYLRARYMDPETGTFLSRDPLAAGPGWLGHPFGYVSANPATLTDPLGLWEWDEWRAKLTPCNWTYVGKAVCQRGIQVIRSVGDGAIQLVKTAGEYALNFGSNFTDWAKTHRDELEFAIGTALGLAYAACWAAAPIATPAAAMACTYSVAPAWRAYLGWKGGDALSSDDQTERTLKTISATLEAIPGGGIWKAFVQILLDFLATPTPAR